MSINQKLKKGSGRQSDARQFVFMTPVLVIVVHARFGGWGRG
tara:strand:+ start:3325 stop:3450 length:126 start_codon:yes stop_codon:yes gene_type:complete